jgi:Tfp pilus assembly protein FimV
MTMVSPADQIAQLEHCVREQMKEIDRLRALIRQKDAELDSVIAWIASDKDALSCLQSVYADPRSTTATKVRAAASAVSFERPRLAAVSGMVVVTGPGVLGARLDQDAGMKTLAPPTTIEAEIVEEDYPAA